jgi:hypothetical protein
MSSFTIGKASCTSKMTGTAFGQAINLLEIRCSPPPYGARREFVADLHVKPNLLTPFLQPSELLAMKAATSLANDDELVNALATQLTYFHIALDIDTFKMPAHWNQRSACFNTIISFQVEYNEYEVVATATEAVELINGVRFPQGDVLAAFRIAVPAVYRFIREYEWNEACCNMPTRVHDTEYSQMFSPLQFRRTLNMDWGFRLELDWGRLIVPDKYDYPYRGE